MTYACLRTVFVHEKHESKYPGLMAVQLWGATRFWIFLVIQIVLSLACASVRLILRTIVLWQYDVTFEDAAVQAGCVSSP